MSPGKCPKCERLEGVVEDLQGDLDGFADGQNQMEADIELARDMAMKRAETAEAANESDRTTIAGALGNARRVIASYAWASEGRGPYYYDDDEYQREFGRCLDEINNAIAPLVAVAKDFSDCPDTQAGVVRARASQKETGAPQECGECEKCVDDRVVQLEQALASQDCDDCESTMEEMREQIQTLHRCASAETQKRIDTEHMSAVRNRNFEEYFKRWQKVRGENVALQKRVGDLEWRSKMLGPPKDAIEKLFNHGGPHLGVVRSWMQSEFFNGSQVTWGSNDQLGNTGLSPLKMEGLAGRIKDAVVADVLKCLKRFLPDSPASDETARLTPHEQQRKLYAQATENLRRKTGAPDPPFADVVREGDRILAASDEMPVCPRCGGNGWNFHNDGPCDHCGGSGNDTEREMAEQTACPCHTCDKCRPGAADKIAEIGGCPEAPKHRCEQWVKWLAKNGCQSIDNTKEWRQHCTDTTREMAETLCKRCSVMPSIDTIADGTRLFQCKECAGRVYPGAREWWLANRGENNGRQDERPRRESAVSGDGTRDAGSGSDSSAARSGQQVTPTALEMPPDDASSLDKAKWAHQQTLKGPGWPCWDIGFRGYILDHLTGEQADRQNASRLSRHNAGRLDEAERRLAKLEGETTDKEPTP
jgi:hypothetical protein